MFNGETKSKQEKEGSQEETYHSQERGATSEFKKVFVVEKTSKQDVREQEEVKSNAETSEPLGMEPKLEPGIQKTENMKPPSQDVLNLLLDAPSEDLTYDKLSQDTYSTHSSTTTLLAYWADTEDSWSSDDSY